MVASRGRYSTGREPYSQSHSRAPLHEAGVLIFRAAALLYVNGQTTRSTELVKILIRIAPSGESGARKIEIVVGPPVGRHEKVMKTVEVRDRVFTGRLGVEEAIGALMEIARLPQASTLRFATLVGAGAAALGVIFGDARPSTWG
jgi:hypothetical protein